MISNSENFNTPTSAPKAVEGANSGASISVQDALYSLKRIVAAHDYYAEHGKFPSSLLGEGQSFDGYVAGFACYALFSIGRTLSGHQSFHLPSDFRSHQHSWREALQIAIEHAEVSSPDIDDKTYWERELRAFDRAYNELPEIQTVAY